MGFTEVVRQLKARGVPCVTEMRIRYAIWTGKVDRPVLNKSLRFEYEDKHVEQLAALLKVERRGRPRKNPKLAIA